MSLLNPLALWFLLLLPLVVGLYFFRQRKRALRVPALFLWEEALGQSSTRRLFRRLRHLWLLVLGLLAVLLLTTALARPEFRDWLVQRRHLVLVVDNSLSMGRRGADGVELLQTARQKARLAVQQLPRDTHAAILQTNPPRVVQGFSADHAALLQALDDVPLSATDAQLGKLSMLVEAMIDSRADDVESVYFTDSPTTAEEVFRSPVRSVVLPAVAHGNVAITAFDARARLEDPSQVEIYAEIRNFSEQPVTADFNLEIAGRSVEARRLSLGPNGIERVALSYLYQPGAVLNFTGLARAQIETATPDALPQDNTAFAVLPQAKILRVLLVSNGNWFLESFLKADSLLTYELVQPRAYTPAIAGGFGLVIFDREIPTTAANALPPHWLALGAVPMGILPEDAEPEPVSGMISEITEVEIGNLQTRALVGIRVAEALDLSELDDSTVGARFGGSDAPALVLLNNRDAEVPGRGAILAFALSASDFPLRHGFPLFMRDLLFWSANHSSLDASRQTHLALGLQPPVDQQIVTVQQETRAGMLPTARNINSITQPGVALLKHPETGAETWVAVNAVNPAESAFVETVSPASPATGRAAQSWGERLPLPDQPPWVLIAIAGALLLCLEWIVYSRRQNLAQPAS